MTRQPSTNTGRVRLGVIGCGSVGERHVRAALALDAVDVVAVTDADAGRARHTADAYDCEAHTSTQSLLADPDVEGVVVATPTSHHRLPAVAAARAGKHVLCEKPMATTLDDCDAIIEASREAGVVLCGCQVMQRRHARLAGAKDVVESGELGALVAMHVRRSSDYPQMLRQRWQSDIAQAGGGVAMTLTTYAIDEFQWFAGSPVRRVTARIPRRQPGDGVECEAMAIFEMGGQLLATSVELGTHMPPSEEMDLILEGGALRLSGDDGLWMFVNGEGRQLVEAVEPRSADGDRAMEEQLAHFADLIRHPDLEPEVSGDQQRSIVATALALYESARIGAPVAVDASSHPCPPRHAEALVAERRSR